MITLSVVAAVLALGVGALTFVLGGPVWLGVVLAVVIAFLVTLAARRAEVKRWGFERRRWAGEHLGTTVEVIFDERLVFLNRLTLVVDGRPVDHTTIWYGTKQLRGGGVTAEVGSGWIGECTGVVLRDEAGGELALSERG